jgi:DNA polymerase
MFVGEQPGDQEDRAGKPFVGPAGRLLRDLLEEAGIDAQRVYVTNAVKHFKWRPRGTRRIHDKPSWSEIQACAHWLGLERAAVRPTLVVCLGATAAQSLFGRTARVGELRGSAIELPEGGQALVTIHPSAVLRADDRDEMRAGLLADLKLAHTLAGSQSTKIAKS